MTGTQATLGGWAPVEHVPGEGLDDDPTPRGVVRAVLGGALELYADDDFRALFTGGLAHLEWFTGEDPPRPLRVLDLGAGYGCWSSELRRLAHAQGWPVHITGVELNPEREPHLRCAGADVVGDGQRTAPGRRSDRDRTRARQPWPGRRPCRGGSQRGAGAACGRRLDGG